MDAAFDFSNFIANTRYENLPDDIVDVIKKQVLDILACAIGGSNRREIAEIYKIVSKWGGKAESRIWGYGRRVPSPNAALVNSMMAFCLDYDDTHDRGRLHGGVVVVPVGLAMSELIGTVSGKDFITALSVGLEIAVRLGIAAKRAKVGHIMGGWDYAALHGFFSGAAVAAKLMCLDEERIQNALGIAYHQACGNAQSALDLADTKIMGPGFAAQGGITSALFAKAGLTGARNIFHESEQSLCNLYHAGCDENALTRGLGQKFELFDLGFKPYPSCRLGHSYIDAVLELVTENNIEAEEIQEIIPHVCQFTHLQLCVPDSDKKRPENTIAAQFSLPWTIACAAVRKNVGINEIGENTLKDQKLLDVAARVHPVLDSSLPDELAPAKVIIKARSEVFQIMTGHAFGTIHNPMSFEDLEKKLYECASHSKKNFPKERLKSMVYLIRYLETIDNINEITGFLD